MENFTKQHFITTKRYKNIIIISQMFKSKSVVNAWTVLV